MPIVGRRQILLTPPQTVRRISGVLHNFLYIPQSVQGMNSRADQLMSDLDN